MQASRRLCVALLGVLQGALPRTQRLAYLSDAGRQGRRHIHEPFEHPPVVFDNGIRLGRYLSELKILINQLLGSDLVALPRPRDLVARIRDPRVGHVFEKAVDAVVPANPFVDGGLSRMANGLLHRLFRGRQIPTVLLHPPERTAVPLQRGVRNCGLSLGLPLQRSQVLPDRHACTHPAHISRLQIDSP